jgi:hypothetical protein
LKKNFPSIPSLSRCVKDRAKENTGFKLKIRPNQTLKKIYFRLSDFNCVEIAKFVNSTTPTKHFLTRGHYAYETSVYLDSEMQYGLNLDQHFYLKSKTHKFASSDQHFYLKSKTHKFVSSVNNKIFLSFDVIKRLIETLNQFQSPFGFGV